jgi:hypothetical protein
MARKPKLQLIHHDDYRYNQCRGPIRHRWDAVGPIVGRRRLINFGTEITFRCEHCGTVKIIIVSRISGEVISKPQYIHPDGYKTERRSSDYWRAAWMDEIENDMFFNREDEAR